jgi:hypothetical protein
MGRQEGLLPACLFHMQRLIQVAVNS